MQQDVKEAKGAQTMTIHLTAAIGKDGLVEITGDKTRVKLPKGSGNHKFKFRLTDDTELNVKFSDFGAALGETCPSSPGDNTGQITNVDIDDKKAEFTDKNSGAPLTFGYSWFFSCDDTAQTPKFDPIVENGGGNEA